MTKKQEKMYSKFDESKVRKSVGAMKNLVEEDCPFYHNSFHHIRLTPERWNKFANISDEWMIDHAEEIHELLLSGVSANDITKAIVTGKGLKSLDIKRYTNAVNMLKDVMKQKGKNIKDTGDILNDKGVEGYVSLMMKMPKDLVYFNGDEEQPTHVKLDKVMELITADVSSEKIAKALLNGDDLNSLFAKKVDEMYVITTGQAVDVDNLGGTTVAGETTKLKEEEDVLSSKIKAMRDEVGNLDLTDDAVREDFQNRASALVAELKNCEHHRTEEAKKAIEESSDASKAIVKAVAEVVNSDDEDAAIESVIDTVMEALGINGGSSNNPVANMFKSAFVDNLKDEITPALKEMKAELAPIFKDLIDVVEAPSDKKETSATDSKNDNIKTDESVKYPGFIDGTAKDAPRNKPKKDYSGSDDYRNICAPGFLYRLMGV